MTDDKDKKTVQIGRHEIPVVTPDELPGVLGIEPGDQVEITTPQFHRDADDPPPACAPIDWDSLRDMKPSALRELGLRPWCDPTDEDWPHKQHELWLLPGEWYRQIPAGYEVVDIFGERESFVPGKTDDDIRAGCLAFGILRGVSK